MISPEHAQQLDERGYVRLPGFIPPGLRAELVARIEALFAAEGDAAGSEFKIEPGARRLANMVDKDPLFAACIAMPAVLAYIEHVLGPRFKLSSLNARSANPHNGHSQPLHADGGSVPDEQGAWVCNTVWVLDDFTAANGALRAVPGTHRAGRLPADVLADPRAPHPDEVTVTAAAGDLIVMNAHLWHGGLANDTDRPRRAMHGYYCRADKPQQQYQKRLLRPAVQARLSPRERQLCALDDPQNDELSAIAEGRSGFMK
jgi:hypothetical protein